jgi:hypothetical protein
MQSGQVSIWVPIVVGIIGLIGVVAGQMVNAWREDRRWRREQVREDLRWRREAEKEAANRAHRSQIDWRERRISAYAEYLEAIRRVIELTTEATSYKTITFDTLDAFESNHKEPHRIAQEIGQRVRLLSSDQILGIMHRHALTLSLPLRVPRLPTLRLTPPTPEEVRKDTEAEKAAVEERKKGLKGQVNLMWTYYKELTTQMRADLGAAELSSASKSDVGK